LRGLGSVGRSVFPLDYLKQVTMLRINSILVATDLHEASDHVMRAAAALASVAGADLHIVHALDLDLGAYAPTGGQTFDGTIRAAEEALDSQIARTVPASVTVASRETIIYMAHRAIVERATAVAADLIVVGPHKQRPFADTFLGTTADRVIRTSSVPCLVVRTPLSLPLRRVVAPVDLSGPAAGALAVALDWLVGLGPDPAAGPTRSRLSVVHVAPRAYDVPDMAFDQEVIAPAVRKEVEAATSRTDLPVTSEIHEEVVWGDDVPAAIVEVLGRERADLVVIATHGRGALKRALVGSVASGVARGAPCPVLLVPPAVWDAENPSEISNGPGEKGPNAG